MSTKTGHNKQFRIMSLTRCFNRVCTIQNVLNPALLSVIKPDLFINPFSTSPVRIEVSLPLATKERVLNLVSQCKESSNFRKSQQKSLTDISEWLDNGGSSLQLSTFNFLLHLCVEHGSAQDIKLAVDLAHQHKLDLGERELNKILTGLSLSGEIEKVKEKFARMRETGMKIRVNTQTSLLERAVNERDIPFTLDVLDAMKKDGSFPSTTNVICEALSAWVGVEGCDGVGVVRGVMGLHNNHSQTSPQREVSKEVASAFSEWITSLPQDYALSETRIGNNCICPKCGEQLLRNFLTQEDFGVLLSHFKEEMSHELGTARNAQLERKMAEELSCLVGETRYGAVLDGLNIAYTLRRTRHDYLLAVAKRLVERTGREVLVIGRPHINRLLPRQRGVDILRSDYSARGVHVFLLNHSSRDDRYLLYAAIACDSLLVSNDEFGDKMHEESWELQRLFQKWQKGRQVRFSFKGTQIKLEYPTVVDRVVKWSEHSWHLPLSTPSHKDWLCAHTLTPT